MKKYIVLSLVGLSLSVSMATVCMDMVVDRDSKAELEERARNCNLTPLAYFLHNCAPAVDPSEGRKFALIPSENLSQLPSFLQRYGDQINRRDGNEFTPLMVAIFYNFPADDVRMFLSAGADPNARDGCGFTALDSARNIHKLYKDQDVIKLLEGVTQQ